MRVPASWHRKPDDQNCPRYFSAALSESRRVEIELSWPADPITGAALRAEKVGMVGTSPNGQGFIANPLRIWVIDERQLSGRRRRGQVAMRRDVSFDTRTTVT
ncbi:MAG: hypothetical protein FD127_1149 [Acidimicrobiaceae bacterium]|nr:MAG: hypothetical protein FD127_1149 [Acidimicrobiaceae bacterium]